jgi:hypothetical protein
MTVAFQAANAMLDIHLALPDIVASTPSDELPADVTRRLPRLLIADAAVYVNMSVGVNKDGLRREQAIE